MTNLINHRSQAGNSKSYSKKMDSWKFQACNTLVTGHAECAQTGGYRVEIWRHCGQQWTRTRTLTKSVWSLALLCLWHCVSPDVCVRIRLFQVGTTFLQLKLVLRHGSERQRVHVELSLPQFYEFLSQMEKLRGTMDYLQATWERSRSRRSCLFNLRPDMESPRKSVWVKSNCWASDRTIL